MGCSAPHDRFSDHIDGDYQKGQQHTNQPGGGPQAFYLQSFATKGDEKELQDENGSHNKQEVFVAAKALEGVDMTGPGIEPVEGDGHHEGGKDGGFQIGDVYVPEQLPERGVVEAEQTETFFLLCIKPVSSKKAGGIDFSLKDVRLSGTRSSEGLRRTISTFFISINIA